MSLSGYQPHPPLPTARQLGIAFGVDDETEKYKQRFNDRFDVFVSAQSLVNSMPAKNPERDTVLNEYAALYLPRHIRACLAAPRWVDQIFYGMLQWMVRFPLFARYFREHPESEMFFRDYTLAFLPVMPTWQDMTQDGLIGPPESECNRLIAWGLVSYEICLHVAYPPTCATLSGLSPTDKRALALKLSPIVIAGERPAYARKHLRPGLRDKLDIVTSSSRRMLAWCTGQRDAKGFLDSVSSGGTILPWIHCQGKGAGKCVSGVGKGEGAEEMMACARCLAVRYCCREHQKADWKLHKQSCFAPAW